MSPTTMWSRIRWLLGLLGDWDTAVGLPSRVKGVITWFKRPWKLVVVGLTVTWAYVSRLPLDQKILLSIVVLLLAALMIHAVFGAYLRLERWLADRRAPGGPLFVFLDFSDVAIGHPGDFGFPTAPATVDCIVRIGFRVGRGKPIIVSHAKNNEPWQPPAVFPSKHDPDAPMIFVQNVALELEEFVRADALGWQPHKVGEYERQSVFFAVPASRHKLKNDHVFLTRLAVQTEGNQWFSHPQRIGFTKRAGN